MPKQCHILCIEDTQFELDSFAEVVEYEGFHIFKATTIQIGRKILQKEQVHLILININVSDVENDYSSIKLISDPLYNDIPKVIIMMDKKDPLHKLLKNVSSLIYISYKEEPDRLDKLVAALKAHFNRHYSE